MGFGTTFGGMGAASEGMDNAAQAENQRIMAHQIQQQNALRYRQMQEQDASDKTARDAYNAQLESMQTPTAGLPQVTGGSVVKSPTAKPAVQAPTPVATTGTGADAPMQRPESGNAERLRKYEQMRAEDRAALDAMRANPNYQAQSDNQALRNVATSVGNATLAPSNAVARGVNAATNLVKRGVNAVTGQNMLQQQPPMELAYSQPQTEEARLLARMKETDNQIRQLRDQGKAAGANPTSAPMANDPQAAQIQTILSGFENVSPVVTPEFVAAIRRVENRSGDPNAVSPKGAFGVMQTMPATFDQMSKTYYGGKLDPKNAQSQMMAGVAYLNHLATVELPRRGIPVTPDNVASAYQQGPAGLAKNGISAGVNDGITNNQKYVQLVNGGAAPAAQGQPTQPTASAPALSIFQPQGDAQAVGGPNIDQSMQQLQQTFQLVKLQAQNTRDPQQKAQLMMQLQSLNDRGQDLQIQQLGHAAMFKPEALTQLVGLFAGQNGIQLAAQQDGKGNVRLAMPDGTPAPGNWGKPMTLASLVDAMQGQLSQGRRAEAARRAAELQAVSDKANAEEGAKGRWKMAETELQGRNAAAIAAINGDTALRAEVVKHGLSENDFKDATPDQNVPGRTIVRKNNMVYLYDAPNNSDPSRPAVAGKITVIPNPS